MTKVSEIIEPEDGKIWRWKISLVNLSSGLGGRLLRALWRMEPNRRATAVGKRTKQTRQ